MSHLPPNAFSNISGQQQMNANSGPPIVNHSQYNQLPQNQVDYRGLKQDSNSNSPHPVTVSAPYSNSVVGPPMNNYSTSANSSPAFNRSGMVPPQPNVHASPVRPPPHTIPLSIPNSNQYPSSQLPPQSVPLLKSTPNANPSPTPFPPTPVNYTQAQVFNHINSNAPPLIPSSQYSSANQLLQNGPALSAPQSLPPSSASFQPPYPPTSSVFNGPPISSRPPASLPNYGPTLSHSPAMQMQGMTPSKPPAPESTIAGPLSGPPPGTTRGPLPPQGHPRASPVRPTLGLHSMPPTGPTMASMPNTVGVNGARSGIPGPSLGPPMSGPPTQLTGPPRGPPSSLPSDTLHLSAPQTGPPLGAAPMASGPPVGPSVSSPSRLPHPNGQWAAPPSQQMNPAPSGYTGLGSSAPPVGPPKINQQSRYPQMQQPINTQVPPLALPNAQQYPGSYGTQGLTQQMGQLSVTKQGFDQLWGHQMVDLLQCRHILPEYPEDPPEIRLAHQFADSPNCSSE